MSFDRVLIANRGEIAIRIAKAADALGIESVAVYAPVDERSLHLVAADHVGPLPGSDPVAAYLDISALLRIAGEHGCDCVHPGYGFLAENAAFVHACAQAGIAFVGPAARHAAAFGDGTVFVERLVNRPRHIEVQVLADHHGNVTHLYERDCSVQQRNQKVIEIAPAHGLSAELRAQLHADAVRLAAEAGLVNAATVEFLVSPEAGEHYFIECNPRIQVEHTVTEQVTGVDLVEAQFRIAAGETLAAAGIGAAGTAEPRGYAVQARVVATGSGAISAYQEPSGAGVRVDAAGYSGYAPPPYYDPLLAKVIATGNTIEAAVARTSSALADFHIGRLPTNIGQLREILDHPAVSNGDARTTLLAEMVTAQSGASGIPNGMGGGDASRRAALLEPSLPGGAAAPVAVPTLPSSTWPDRELGDDEIAVSSPLPASVVEVRVSAGDAVAAGQALVVLSAMKMETEVTAPSAGTITALRELQPGDQLAAGDVLAVMTATALSGTPAAAEAARSGWEPLLDEVQTLQRLAEKRLGPDSDEPGVVRQRSRGKLHCRDRIRLLLDEGSFREVGSLAGFASYDDDGETAAFTPANHVGGTGTIESRGVVVCADDFTSPRCRWSTCCSAAWSASEPRRPSWATSPSWCATSRSCSWQDRRSSATRWATTFPRKTSATGAFTARTARWTTWPRPRRRQPSWCDKLTRHIDLCDLFHVPILNLCDNPGFAVGVEHEIAGTIRKGATWMTAFAQATVPIFTVLMRRSFGVAGNNYATPRRQHSARVVWPAADVGGIPPEGGIEAAYKRQLAEAEDPVALRAELEARIEAARGPIGPLNRFQIEEMIDPRETRRLICEWIEGAYRIASRPAQLVARPIAFRP